MAVSVLVNTFPNSQLVVRNLNSQGLWHLCCPSALSHAADSACTMSTLLKKMNSPAELVIQLLAARFVMACGIQFRGYLEGPVKQHCTDDNDSIGCNAVPMVSWAVFKFRDSKMQH